ncbi:alginate export family protein [Sphingomonas sp. DT-51]|uniref:alginate export family protein n=1 Tax=Sphingomonas sp. DT-51 TaxID=3396165 RepID=UPI003F1C96FD
MSGICLAPALLAATPAMAQARGANAAPAAPIASEYPAAGMGEGTAQGKYNVSRWVEDWRGMADPARRDDALDRLKFLPLTGDGSVYLTLSGELRYRVQATTNPDLRDRAASRQERLRVLAGADLHLGEHVRVFGELAKARVDGENIGTPAGNLRNALTLSQGFGEVYGTIAGANVGVRAGRQEFSDGPNLLTSVRDDPTLHFVLDGVRGYARGKRVRADLFDLRYVAYGQQGLSDDRTDAGRRFTGVTLGYAVPNTFLGGSKLFFDPFVWRLRNRAASWNGTVAREERMFYGLHLYGDAGPVTLDWTLDHQGGTFDGRPISAWQAFVAQTYRLGTAATAPRVGVHMDYASGGGAYGEGTLRTASGLYGNNIYYSYQLFLTPTNLLSVSPNVTVTPFKPLRVTGEYTMAWRATERDAVYRASGAAFAGTEAVAGRRIADLIRLQAIWSVTPRVSLTGRYEHLIAKDALTRAGYHNSDFLAAWLSLRF